MPHSKLNAHPIYYTFMSPQVEASRRMFSTGVFVHLSVYPSVRPSVRYQNSEHDILKANDPILLQIGTSGQRDKEIKRSTSEVKRSKVKVT